MLSGVVPRDPPERGPYGYAHIPLREGAVPVRQKPFHLNGGKFEAHKKVTKEWLDNGYLEEAEGGPGRPNEWLSMTFPVPKKVKGEWRGVVDMRGPNSQTRTVNYPLPVIEDLLVKQGSKQMWSILDLKQAFHQQPLDPASRPITTCWTPLGLYQWKFNVMGLKNAPQQFQQMIDWVLAPVRDIAVAYIDDILIGTRVEEGQDLLEQHLRDVRRVLKRLGQFTLVVDPKNANLFSVRWSFVDMSSRTESGVHCRGNSWLSKSGNPQGT